MRKRVAMVVGVVAAVAAVSVAAVGMSSAAVQPNVVTGVSVPANQTWTATGISLTFEQKVTVSATGTIFGCMNSTCPFKPAGQKYSAGQCLHFEYLYATTEPFPAPGINCYSLMAKVGPSGPPFPIGAKLSFKAPVSGELYLGINDNRVSDNSGSWSATVETS